MLFAREPGFSHDFRLVLFLFYFIFNVFGHALACASSQARDQTRCRDNAESLTPVPPGNSTWWWFFFGGGLCLEVIHILCPADHPFFVALGPGIVLPSPFDQMGEQLTPAICFMKDRDGVASPGPGLGFFLGTAEARSYYGAVKQRLLPTTQF